MFQHPDVLLLLARQHQTDLRHAALRPQRSPLATGLQRRWKRRRNPDSSDELTLAA